MKEFFTKNILRTIYRFLIIFKKEYRIFLKDNNPKYRVPINYFLPCLKDKTEKTSVEPIYFFQDTWMIQNGFYAQFIRY